MPERIRVAVVDDHPLFRAGVVFTVRSAPDMEIVAEGATAQEAVQIGGTMLRISCCSMSACREVGSRLRARSIGFVQW